MSQFASVSLTQLSLSQMSPSINIKATSVEHPPTGQQRFMRDILDRLNYLDRLILSLEAGNGGIIHILCVSLSSMWTVGSKLVLSINTDALHESSPPTAPQLQRLPNGYPLVFALWSSTGPLGWGLVCLQVWFVCVCMLHHYTACMHCNWIGLFYTSVLGSVHYRLYRMTWRQLIFDPLQWFVKWARSCRHQVSQNMTRHFSGKHQIFLQSLFSNDKIIT